MNKIAFSKDELQKDPATGAERVVNRPITPKENFMRAVRHEDPLWIPCLSEEITFTPRIIPDNVARAFVNEAKPYDGPVGGLDMFGVPWEYIPSVGGSMVRPGKPFLDDISRWKEVIKFPNIEEWDWEGSAEENKEYLNHDHYIETWMFTGFFERLISFIEFENALMALIDEDECEYVKELFQALVDLYKDILTHLKKYFDVDGVFFHDDWGGQKASFFSPDMCREMIAPYLKQIVDHCHDIGMIFNFHSCGKIENLVPIMIECGMDKWGGQPINDKIGLIAQYGDKILMGAPDTIAPPPGGTFPPREVLDEKVDEYLEKYGAGLPEKLFFFQNFSKNPDEYAAFYTATRKLMTK